MADRGVQAHVGSAMTDGHDDPVETRGGWIGEGSRPVASWLSRRPGSYGSTGVLIAPPAGYEYLTSYRTLRVLAELLAHKGCTVLRMDYDGCGDSAGDQWDPYRVACMRRSIGAGVDELHRLGATRLVLVGLRLGATLALLEASALHVDEVVAWAPIVSGRRYAKELRLMGTAVPELPGRSETRGAVVFAGSVFAADTLADLASLDLTELETSPAARTLVIDAPGRLGSDALVERLAALGGAVEHRVLDGSESILELPTEYATVPAGIVETIAEWIGESPVAESGAGQTEQAATMTWGNAELVEEFVSIGPSRLIGVLGRPAAGRSRATVVFLNTGSEPHTGPGRAWVEYARRLTLAGYATLRVDFTGWGESPDCGRAPGRPYDAHTVADTREIVEALSQDGHDPIVLVGLCAGAWVGLAALLDANVAGMVALNPQLYWAPGDPVEATMTETRARRIQIRRREALGGRFGIWTALDIVGVHHRAATWLRRIRRRGIPVLMLFAAGDDGIEFLRNRTNRTLQQVIRSGVVSVVEVPEIDHAMHRHWHRPTIVAEIESFLVQVTANGKAARQPTEQRPR